MTTEKLTNKELANILDRTWNKINQKFGRNPYLFLNLINDTTIRIYPSEKQIGECTVQITNVKQKYLMFSKSTTISRAAIKITISNLYSKLFKEVQKQTTPIDKQNMDNLQSIFNVVK